MSNNFYPALWNNAAGKNILLIGTVAFYAGIQAAIASGGIFALGQVACFYVGLCTAIASQGILLCRLRARLDDAALSKQLRYFVVIESVLVFLLLSAVFKTIIYDYRSLLAKNAVLVLIGASIVHKFAYKFFAELLEEAFKFVTVSANQTIIRPIALICAAAGIAAVIYTPDIQGIVARMFLGEQFHHIDIFIMSPGWAALKGHLLGVDQISQYGLGMPYILGKISAWMGGFTYEHILQIIVVSNIIYYIAWFFFLYRWWGSLTIAAAAVITGMRTQMFHPGIYPCVLTYPSSTVIRYVFDLIVFFCIARHLFKGDRRSLLLGSLFCGIAIFYMDSTGISLTAAFIAYVVFTLFLPHTRGTIYKGKNDLGFTVSLFLLAPLTALGCVYATVGRHVFTPVFWANMLETVDYFLSGIGTYPMYESFKYNNFFAGIVGFLIPVVYVATVVLVGALCYWRKLDKKHILVIVLCVYGLGLNHYYIARSLQTSYYVSGLPYIFVLFYWINMGLAHLPIMRRPQAKAAVFLVSVYALMTTHLFMFYPNVLNVSRNPLVDKAVALPLPADGYPYFNHLFRKETEEAKVAANSLGETDEQIYAEDNFPNDEIVRWYYAKESDFSKDAALIRSLTAGDEKVPLISSFETKLLMQADRAPFFYYFPLLNARPMHMRTFPVNFLHTNTEKFLQTALDQIKAQAPKYIFMERILLNRQVPKGYLDRAENIMPIIDYVNDHYLPAAYGQYLVAMKHKD